MKKELDLSKLNEVNGGAAIQSFNPKFKLGDLVKYQNDTFKVIKVNDVKSFVNGIKQFSYDIQKEDLTKTFTNAGENELKSTKVKDTNIETKLNSF